MACGLLRSQQMASIALTIIGLIGQLDIGAIFMRAVILFVARRKQKIEFFDSRKKAVDACQEAVELYD